MIGVRNRRDLNEVTDGGDEAGGGTSMSDATVTAKRKWGRWRIALSASGVTLAVAVVVLFAAAAPKLEKPFRKMSGGVINALSGRNRGLIEVAGVALALAWTALAGRACYEHFRMNHGPDDKPN